MSREPEPPPTGGTIVVIGAGATGALVANELLRLGYRVTIVEKAKPGNGSSSRSAACIRAQFDVRETVIGMMYSEAFYREFYGRLGVPAEFREQAVIIENGYLWLYESPESTEPWRHAERQDRERQWKTAQKNAAMQREIGLPVEVLKPDEVGQRWPHLADSAWRLAGATFCGTDGFLRHDLVYTVGIRQAMRLGAVLIMDAEVIGSVVERGRIVALRMSQDGAVRDLRCDGVVNATNAWAPRVSKAIGGCSLPIAPTKRYLVTQDRPVNHFSDEQWRGMPMTIYGMTAGRGSYSRPEGPSQVIYGWAHPTPPEPDFVDEDQDRIAPGFGHDHRDQGMPFAVAIRGQVEEFSPWLADGPLTGTTSGFYGVTPDHNPLIGRDPRVDNLVHAAGFSGHGLMHAPITAVLVGAIFINRTKLDERRVRGQIREDRFVELPEPFTGHRIALGPFSLTRDFSESGEGKVL